MSALAIAKLIYDLIPEKAKEIATERFTNSAIDTAQKLWEKIRSKAQEDARAEKTLQAVEAGEKEKLNRLQSLLEEFMDDDSEFAEEVKKLAEEIKQGEIPQQSKNTQNNYDNSTGFQTSVEKGGKAFVGTNNFYQSPESSD